MEHTDKITLRPRKRRKTVRRTREPFPVYVTTSHELVYITAERGHWGVMLSELDELGSMICRRCVAEGSVVEWGGVVYTPPATRPCENETFRQLWVESLRALPH